MVFLYLFAKNERDNITDQERQALSELDDEYMLLTAGQLSDLLHDGILTEVLCDDKANGGQPDTLRGP